MGFIGDEPKSIFGGGASTGNRDFGILLTRRSMQSMCGQKRRFVCLFYRMPMALWMTRLFRRLRIVRQDRKVTIILGGGRDVLPRSLRCYALVRAASRSSAGRLLAYVQWACLIGLIRLQRYGSPNISSAEGRADAVLSGLLWVRKGRIAWPLDQR